MAAEPCVDEFERMPPALRRKLFSNLERFRLEQIRLAQTHQDDDDIRRYHVHQRQPPGSASSRENSGSASSPTSPRSPRRALPCTKNRRFLKKDRRRVLLRNSGKDLSWARKLRRADFSQPTSLVSHAEAEWFRALPPKIQRRHFSPEERVRFTNSWRSSAILDAADKALYRRGQEQQKRQWEDLDKRRRASISSVASAPTLSSGPSLSSATMASSEDPVDGTADTRDSIYDSFRWLDEDDELDLSLGEYDYHNHITRDSSAATPAQSNHQRRPSFRRTFSLTTFQRNSRFIPPLANNRSGRPTTQAFVGPASTTPSRTPSTTRRHERSFSRSMSNPVIPKHGAQSSVTSIEQPAQYYQDPDARLKLRVYLASPQKFDEAIEFGFPSLDERNDNSNNAEETEKKNRKNSTNRRGSKDDKSPPRIPTARRSRSYEKEATFLENSSISYLDDITPTTDSKTLEQAFSSGPPSPTKSQKSQRAVAERQLQSQPPQPDPASDPTTTSNPTTRQPRPVRPQQRLSQNLSGGREMTLKMTLTRADLRSADSASGGAGGGGCNMSDDPLRLAALPAADESRPPIWEPSEQQGAVKRMWQKLKRRRP